MTFSFFLTDFFLTEETFQIIFLNFVLKLFMLKLIHSEIRKCIERRGAQACNLD